MRVNIDEIVMMQQTAVARWHCQGLDNPFSGFLAIACHQCSLNYLLWHEEDAARSPIAQDGEIALIKRTIDQLNQQRNDYIEQMDLWIAETLMAAQVLPVAGATLNTETPGSAIDRLSILALRIYHLEEQLRRPEVDAPHLETVGARLSICHLQRDDLFHAAGQLLNDIFGGRRRHQVYRQFKMYNDPSLNPYLYRTGPWRQTPPSKMDNTRADAGVEAWPAAAVDPAGVSCNP